MCFDALSECMDTASRAVIKQAGQAGETAPATAEAG